MSMNKVTKQSPGLTMTTYEAGIMQASTHRILQKFCDEVLKPYDISKMQWLIIGTVLDSGKNGIRITDLANKLSTTLSYLTNTINLLESKGMLVRINSPSDERSKMIVVEPMFESKCDEIEKVLREKLRERIYAEVSLKDFETYMKVLQKLSRVG